MRESGAVLSGSSAVTTPVPAPGGRLLSLDVFRGGTIAAMILVNDPGSAAVYAPLEHAEWHGWTFTDMVFPFFLWIVGVAMTLSFAGRRARGENRRALLLHVLRRAAIIFAIGLFLNGFPYFRLATIRIPGVLQRIALCYLCAATIYLYTGLRAQAAWIAALLAGYWMAMTLIPVPGYGPGVLQPIGNLAQWVDSQLLAGHMWSRTKVWDPEGLLSTAPAVATTLLGALAGHLLRAPRLTAAEKTAWMLAWGNAMLFAAQCMNPFFPINKNLWTTSFTVHMAGMALIVFGICYWLVDVHGWRCGTGPFVVFGMNAIAMFVLSGLLARILGLMQWRKPLFETVFAPLAGPRDASLLYAVSFTLVCYAAAWLLYRKRWFVKF